MMSGWFSCGDGYIMMMMMAVVVSVWQCENGNENENDNGSHDSGSGGSRTLHTARGCTYKEFLNCQPLNFKGTEGAVGLAHWFEKMASVFHINNCAVESYGIPWKNLMKMMTEAYYLGMAKAPETDGEN
ncbi:hypothetical protein Tco_0949637 [Tanacetum coccineum]